MCDAPAARLGRLLSWILVVGHCAAAPNYAQEAPLRAPAGFEVTLWADDALAHNITCMTVNARGQVVVAGPGYVRTLLDEDSDGRCDRAVTFADVPANGAQGMCFDGADLLCVGDAGVLRLRDADGDQRADGPAKVVVPMRTGGEHHAHALRRGPDGWWYLIVGNDTGVTEQLAGNGSPVQRPAAGALLRFAPDFSSSQVYADGFRNAYDFDFAPSGEIFTFDSDGERDVSLPWYRPTRVLQVLPASHAGWVSRSWKRHDDYMDMPPVAASLGRGSPTGVACYRHESFPEPYQGALFVADWTFGRVMAVSLQFDEQQGCWRGEPQEFLRAVGQFGFAPTDIEVGTEGELYVSVGGRGTRGGVYRVRWIGDGSPTAAKASGSSDGEGDPKRDADDRDHGDAAFGRSDAAHTLEGLLSAPLPLSSARRVLDRTTIASLGRKALEDAVISSEFNAAQRARAIELLVEHFAHEPTCPLHSELLMQLDDAPASVRARAAWGVGRIAARRVDEQTLRWLAEQLAADDPQVVRCALEALLSIAADRPIEKLGELLIAPLNHEATYVRQLAAYVVNHHASALRSENFHRHPQLTFVGRVTAMAGMLLRPQHHDGPLFAELCTMFAQSPPQHRGAVLRAMQLALGDVGPGAGHKAVFDGYASSVGPPPEEVHGVFPMVGKFGDNFDFESDNVESDDVNKSRDSDARDRRVLYEWARVAAIVRSESAAARELVLQRITETSDPTDDVHWLIVAARLAAPYTARHREQIAAALVAIDDKLDERERQRDLNWQPRMLELYDELCRGDAELPAAVIRQDLFGHPGHVWMLATMRGMQHQKALDRFIERMGSGRYDVWTPAFIAELQRGGRPEDWRQIRAQADNPAVQSAVIRALAPRAAAEDRMLLIAGLRDWQPDVVHVCVDALLRLPVAGSSEQLAALVALLRRTDSDARSVALRDKAVRLLERATGQTFGYQFEEARPQPEVIDRWVAWLEQHHAAAARQWLPNVQLQQSLRARLAGVEWDAGNIERGAALFARKGCVQCHRSRTALGPDLAGVAQRFAPQDLFLAIADPSRDISERYATTVVETQGGKIYQGALIYDSVDGVTLLTPLQETVRIEAGDIAVRRVSSRSLMPDGLLDDMQPSDFADLLAYLRTLDVPANSDPARQ